MKDDQLFIPTSKIFKVPLQEAKKKKKKKKTEKKLNLKINRAPICHIFFRKKMILLNETSREETKNKLEKGEKSKNLFSGNKGIAKR